MNPARLLRQAARVEGERRARPLNRGPDVGTLAININDELDLLHGDNHAARIMLIAGTPHKAADEITLPQQTIGDFLETAGSHPQPELFAIRQMHFDRAVHVAHVNANLSVAKIDLIHRKLLD